MRFSPKSVDAQILKGNALAGLKDFDGAIATVESRRCERPLRQCIANLGLLQLAKGDSAAAEFAFKKAVESDPKSVNARLALANYYWSTNRRDTAEATLKRATALDPKNELANRALALFYLGAGHRPG